MLQDWREYDIVVFSNLNVRPQQSDREYCAMITKLFRYDLYIEVHTFHPQWTKILTISFLSISIYGLTEGTANDEFSSFTMLCTAPSAVGGTTEKSTDLCELLIFTNMCKVDGWTNHTYRCG